MNGRGFHPEYSADAPEHPPSGGSRGKAPAAAAGCIYPPGANRACDNLDCPRKGRAARTGDEPRFEILPPDNGDGWLRGSLKWPRFGARLRDYLFQKRLDCVEARVRQLEEFYRDPPPSSRNR
jgi:hypothetical protein